MDGCIKKPFGMEVGLSRGDFVLDGDPASRPLKGHSPPNFQSMSVVAKRLDGLIKMAMALGMEVGLGPGELVFGGDPAIQKQRVHPLPPSYFQTAGWMKNATWYGSRPRSMPHCIRRAPSAVRNGHSSPLFSARVYCGHGRPSQLLLSSLKKFRRDSMLE